MNIPPPTPKSLLGRHRLLAPTASVRVSPLSFGGMSLGTNWGRMMGECSKEMAFELLDTYYDLGGNFIDTANVYQGGQSEEWIGEWMQKNGNRHNVVLATKYVMGVTPGQSNSGGTGTKSMHVAIEASLKRLRTDHIDLYYVHCWDYATGIPELMQSLNTLVQQGKVLYLGISDTPAWVVVKANEYARQHGLRQFSVYQGRFSALVRDMERDIIPMCIDEGMAIHAWGVVGNGSLKSASDEKQRGKTASFLTTGKEEGVSEKLDVVAKRLGIPMQAVAIAYVLHKAPYVFPVVGGRSISHLKSNVEALKVQLDKKDIAEIEAGYDFDPGFPHAFIGIGGKAPRGPADIGVTASLGYFDYASGVQPVKPHQGELNAAGES